jgi:hypothetical protein
MKQSFYLLSITALLFGSSMAYGQEDLMNIADEASGKQKEFTTAAFKTTRITSFQSIETLGKRTLDFRIMHRFGPLNSGAEDAFGLDGPASIKLSLEYSYDGRLMFGLGRSSQQKLWDGFLKYRLLRQTTDNRNPFSITLFTSAFYSFLKDNKFPSKYSNELYRLSFCHQIIIARKFSTRFSLQIAPTVVHYNLVDLATDKNDVYALLGAARFKVSNRQAITFEYGYRLNKYYVKTDKIKYYDSMGIGWEIETGGHVFQMHWTNSFGIVESQFIPHSDTSWKDWGIRLGFNISRVFTVGKIKE